MAREPPLDEIEWRNPHAVAELGGLHSNTILYYFAYSPFFVETSNNAVLFSQAMHNPHMTQFIATREAFEARLKTMSGLEFMVTEEPAIKGPGMGTGVWVISKQTRKKTPGMVDEVTVHATYFIVGENIYQAPTLADILESRIALISNSLQKLLPAAEGVRTWTPASGYTYKKPPVPGQTTNKVVSGTTDSSTVGTPAAAAAGSATAPSGPSGSSTGQTDEHLESLMLRTAEEALALHLTHGSNYIDEVPITGEPGNFYLATTTARKPTAASQLAQGQGQGAADGQTPVPAHAQTPVMGAGKTATGKEADGTAGVGSIQTKDLPKSPLDGETKSAKSGKTPREPKLKRRKSKILSPT